MEAEDLPLNSLNFIER